MVEWTDQERSILNAIFSSLDYEDVGPKALSRCLIVYPWTQRYFAGFGNLYNPEAIKPNPNIANHGIKVLHGLDRAAELSVLHSEKLHVDPDNFKLLSDCLTIVIATKMGNAFTGVIQAASRSSWPGWCRLWEDSTTKSSSVLPRTFHGARTSVEKRLRSFEIMAH
uniref:Globin domain-containing protein n=1 Tax=Mola mola TaxID=94237 RepID=A0A3Q4AHZ1_MOLML